MDAWRDLSAKAVKRLVKKWRRLRWPPLVDVSEVAQLLGIGADEAREVHAAVAGRGDLASALAIICGVALASQATEAETAQLLFGLVDMDGDGRVT